MKCRRNYVLLHLIPLVTLVANPARAAVHEARGKGGHTAANHFVSERVDSIGSTGTLTSLALDSLGNPFIAYRDETNRALKLATKARGVWAIETVDPNAGSGGESSFLAANPIRLDARGRPCIAYTNIGRKSLSYAVRSDAGWRIEDVDATGCCVASPSLALDAEGNPSIAYVGDTVATYIKLASKKNGIWSVSTVATAMSIPGCNLALGSNGEPHIVFTYQNVPLTYIWRTGSTWIREIVDSTAQINREGLSIALDSVDSPYVSYYTIGDGPTIRLASRQSGAWIHETVDSLDFPQLFPGAGFWTSIALGPQGEPGIAYYNFVRNPIRYAVRSDRVWTYAGADSTFGVGYFASLARDRWGNPSISYHGFLYEQFDDLRYADSAIHLISPWSGERWKPGTTQTVEWAGRFAVNVLISMDSGRTYMPLGLLTEGGTVTVPEWWTTSARIKIVRDEPYSESTSPGLFSIAPDPGLRLSLGPPRPNPVRGAGPPTLSLDLPRSGSVTLELYDAQGRLVANMPRRSFVTGGLYPIIWDPGPRPSGVYFLRVKTDWGGSAGTKWVQLK